MGEILTHPQRLEHVAGFQRCTRARGAAAHRDVLETHHQRLAFHVGEADVEDVRQALVRVTVPVDLPVRLEVIPILGEVKEGRRVATGIPKKGPGLRITGFTMLGEVKVRTRKK